MFSSIPPSSSRKISIVNGDRCRHRGSRSEARDRVCFFSGKHRRRRSLNRIAVLTSAGAHSTFLFVCLSYLLLDSIPFLNYNFEYNIIRLQKRNKVKYCTQDTNINARTSCLTLKKNFSKAMEVVERISSLAGTLLAQVRILGLKLLFFLKIQQH